MRTTSVCIALFAAATAATPARGQQPVWDAPRHLMVVTSTLDSADAYAETVRAFVAEGLIVEHDTVRGRIMTTLRPSDSYGGGTASIQYLALVHRVREHGSEIWLGGLVRTRPSATATNARSLFRSRTQPELEQQPEGDVFYLGPSGGSTEWQRLQRIAEAVARAQR